MIKLDKISLPIADVGPLNPLPDIMNNTYIHAGYEMTPHVKPEDAENIGKGMIPTMLPYLTQDGYTRNRKISELPVVVLENQYLRAEFLPCFGGRLWSLYDKQEQRDLIYKNPVFQPCNLALRNAWFSGGVEFNVGIKGHNPLTCSPLFAKIQEDENGNEVLSMYEFERIRGVTFSINAWLPEDSKILYVKNVIENTSPTDTYMYWWTNIAVPQSKGTRIMVPTNHSFVSFYNADHYVMDYLPIPNTFDTDVSYPSNLNRSMDFFYKIQRNTGKWIASANEEGQGLVHFSESILKGRKLFLWGQGNGGKHWGEFLAGAQPHSGEGYLEIQAGLARTQLEHFIMSANSTLSWTECFASLCGNAKALHGSWDVAREEVYNQIMKYTSRQGMDEFLQNKFPELSTLKTKCKVNNGSGWGQLENKVRKELGLSPISTIHTDWDTEKNDETAFWMQLLEEKDLSLWKDDTTPKSYINDLPCHNEFWEKKLKNAVVKYKDSSYVWNQYGVTLYASGKKAEAEACFQTSSKLGNPYAWRNLASYHFNEVQQKDLALEEMEKAVDLLPHSLPLAREYAFMHCGRKNDNDASIFLKRFPQFPSEIQEDKRMQLWRINALVILDDLEEASQLLTEDFTVADIKEGELSMSALWFEIYARKTMKQENILKEEAYAKVKTEYPLPYTLDFRMHE